LGGIGGTRFDISRRLEHVAILLAVAGALIGAAVLAHSASALPGASSCLAAGSGDCTHAQVVRLRPFGPKSIWNDRLGRRAPLSARSDEYASTLAASVERYGAWVNTTQWSTPVYSVPQDQPTVAVQLDDTFGSGQALQQALDRVPIPKDARPSDDTDAHMVVYQRSTDSMWELWGARLGPTGWEARSGGRMTHLSTDPGYFPSDPGWGATASGLPMLGGLIRIHEIRAGLIPHALSIAIPQARAGLYAWPAQQTDGFSSDPSAIPEGTRFRIDPSVNLARIPMSPFVRLLARAAQRYGIYAADQSDDVSFMAEDPTPTGANPYPGFFGGSYPDELLRQFPWDALEVVDAPVHCCG
jgi:hypothetical protein